MLTEEQIKKLKEGDSLQLDVVFFADVDHEILIKAPTVDGHWLSDVFSPAILSLPPAKPKYDPCRKFKKGDLVTPKKVNGRSSSGVNGEMYRVCQDELESGCEIKLVMDGCIGHVPVNAAYLELVTPVEEQEPYFVLDSPHAFHICKRDGSKFTTFYKDQPLAREHAEKYCAALNAAYRKEQQ